MKRYGNLWPQIIDFENLLQAARQAQRCKRFRPNVLAFNYNLESELQALQHELTTQTYQPGTYRTFQILDPKPRFISAAPYRDRVVHHALCNIITPCIDATFIHDSYANRVRKGSHRALRRFIQFARTHRYVLQCDIRKYFPTIDHSILKAQLRAKIKCPQTLSLIETIIDHSNPQEQVIQYFPDDDLLTPVERRKGLPIGNLTSQFFANVYLNSFDHRVKERLNAPAYLRYMDDFAVFSNDQGFLREVKVHIEAELSHLRLKLHPIKSQIMETRHGVNFVGFRVLPDRVRIRNTSLRRTRRWLRRLTQHYATGKVTSADVTQRWQSWQAHALHGDTHQLRCAMLAGSELPELALS